MPSTYYTIITRVKPDQSQVFYTGFSDLSIQRSFVVRDDEISLYFCLVISGVFKFLQLSTTDGSIILGITNTAMASTYSSFGILVLNPSNSMLYFGTSSISGGTGSICRMPSTIASMKCVEIGSVGFIRSIAYINDNEIFYSSIEFSGTRQLYMGRIK